MQQSLKRALERQGASRQRAEPQAAPAQAPDASRRQGKKGSALLSALSAQLVRGGVPPGTAAAAASCGSGGAPAGQPLTDLPLNVPAAAQQPRSKRQDQQRPRAAAAAAGGSVPSSPPPEQQAAPAPVPAGMQACPLCGRLLPVGEALQQHVEQELLQIEEEEAAAAGEQAWSPAERQQQQGGREQQPWHAAQQQRGREQQPQQQQQCPSQAPRQPAVLVLGGPPALTAPTDRRRLQQLQRHLPKRPRQQLTQLTNHYADGGGTWVGFAAFGLAWAGCACVLWAQRQTACRRRARGSQECSLFTAIALPTAPHLLQAGEDIGLDSAAAGLKWEGMGTSDF